MGGYEYKQIQTYHLSVIQEINSEPHWSWKEQISKGRN